MDGTAAQHVPRVLHGQIQRPEDTTCRLERDPVCQRHIAEVDELHKGDDQYRGVV